MALHKEIVGYIRTGGGRLVVHALNEKGLPEEADADELVEQKGIGFSDPTEGVIVFGAPEDETLPVYGVWNDAGDLAQVVIAIDNVKQE
jgi:hypothetical protein